MKEELKKSFNLSLMNISQYRNGIIASRGCSYDTFVSEPISSSKSFTFMWLCIENSIQLMYASSLFDCWPFNLKLKELSWFDFFMIWWLTQTIPFWRNVCLFVTMTTELLIKYFFCYKEWRKYQTCCVAFCIKFLIELKQKMLILLEFLTKNVFF
jgi:hypothetical protein